MCLLLRQGFIVFWTIGYEIEVHTGEKRNLYGCLRGVKNVNQIVLHILQMKKKMGKFALFFMILAIFVDR